MKNKKLSEYIKLFFIGLAVAGVLWNAAILHNDVWHLQKSLDEVKEQVKLIQTYLLEQK